MNPFDSHPVAYSLIHANLPVIFRSVASYPRSLINVAISGGLIYIHSHPKAVSALGWNPPFRAYTAVIWAFLASNVFLAIVPWIPPAPGYQVYERLPYFVSTLRGPRFRACVPRGLTDDQLTSYSCTAQWRWLLDLWVSRIGM